MCGIGAAVATWVAIDVAAVNVDEFLNRAEMEEELRSALENQREVIRNQLTNHYSQVIDAEFKRMSEVFIIIDDG